MKYRLPVVVCAVVGDALSGSGSHATLETLFRRAGAPGEAPDLSHATKWKEWLLRSNHTQGLDPLDVLGRTLEEFMEEPPPFDEEVARTRVRAKERVVAAFEKYGLKYKAGGRVVQTLAGGAQEGLGAALQRGNFDQLEVEFDRARENLEADPGVAITAACALIEALCRAYLEGHAQPLPSKKTVKPLWAAVQKHLGLDPKSQVDPDIQRVLGGLSGVVDGIGAFRTHGGSAHGGGTMRYRPQPRHARLVVNAAHTLAMFIIETWQARDAGEGS